MAFSLIKAGGWAFGEILTSAQMDALDADHAAAIDGVGGGTYAPSNPIVVGGDGLSVTGPFACSGPATFTSTVTLGNAESDTITVNGLLVINNDLVIDNDVQLGSGGADAISVDGVATFSNEATFEDGIDVTGGGATIVGNTEVTGTFEVSSDVTVGDDLTVQDDATVHGNFYCSGNVTSEDDTTLGSNASKTLTVNAQLITRLQFSGNGRVGIRALELDDANQTVTVAEANTLLVPAGLGGTRIYKLSNTGAVEGYDWFQVFFLEPNSVRGASVQFRRTDESSLYTLDTTDIWPFLYFLFVGGRWELVYRQHIE